MSYCQCIKCNEMTSMYAKYCYKCVETHNLKQDEDWHNRKENWYGEYDSNAEFEKDKL